MSPAATALIQEVMREMRRCQEYGLSAPLTRWLGMLRKAGEGADMSLKGDAEKPIAPPEYGWSNGKPPDMDALVAEWLRVNQKGDGRGVYWSDFPLGVVRSLLERIKKQEAIMPLRGAALDAPEQP